MSDPKHPIHDLFSPRPGDEADTGVKNSIDQRPRDGVTQGIDQEVGESVGAPRGTRETEGGIETLPPKGGPI